MNRSRLFKLFVLLLLGVVISQFYFMCQAIFDRNVTDALWYLGVSIFAVWGLDYILRVKDYLNGKS
jgi:hypothetical protein